MKTFKKEEDEKEKIRKKPRSKKIFFSILAIISILSFVSIISRSLFGTDISGYVDFTWLFIIGLGMLIQTRWRALKTLREGFNRSNFPNLVTLIMGVITILASILSLPPIGLENLGFSAVKGIIAIIAIIIIIIQTWVVRDSAEEK